MAYSRILQVHRRMRLRFSRLGKLSATTLLWPLPCRRMEWSGLRALVNAAHSILVNCEPWPEWIKTRSIGLRRQAFMRWACKTPSAACRLCIDQPTTRREQKSSTTARSAKPSILGMSVISVAQPLSGIAPSNCRASAQIWHQIDRKI